MRVAVARVLVDDVLASNGYEHFGLTRAPKLWGRPGTDVVPYFLPHVLRRHGAARVMGMIGVYVPAFEATWLARLKRHGDRYRGYRLLFGSQLTNYLIDPPLFGNREDAAAALADWMATILGMVAALPDSLPQLLGDLEQGKFGPHPAVNFLGHWVHWLAFLHWLEAEGHDHTPNLRDLNGQRRIEPYEPIYRELTKARST